MMRSSDAEATPPREHRVGVVRAGSLAFLTAFVTLFLQVLVHRVVAAKLLNNFVFLVISLTMLGFAVSGVLLTRLLPRFLERLDDAVAASAALLVLTALGATALFYRADIHQAAAYRPDFVVLLLGALRYALLFAIPFLFSGLILGALLSSPDLPTPRIYFCDLLGSAAGAGSVIPAVSKFGAEGALLLATSAMLAGAWVLAPPRRSTVRFLAGAAALALAVCTSARGRVFDMRYPEGTMLAMLHGAGGPYGIETVVWDPVARIEVSRIPPPESRTHNFPCLIGDAPAFHARFRRMLTQNNFAFTYAVDYDGTRQSLDGIERTIYAAAYQASSVSHPKVGIVGVGGGFDILNALYFGASHVTAVEINAATVSILRDRYRDYFRHWVRDPRVELVLDEGRHHLSVVNEKYDVLQLSGVDSYAGTAAAAHVFSENYLYTSEAWDLYLSRLTDHGIVNMMRLEYPMPCEMLRALVTAVGALRRAGVANPADHIVTLTAKPIANFTALLVKRTPFNADELRRLDDWSSSNPYFQVSAAPGRETTANEYQRFLALTRREAPVESGYVASYPLDISPAEDDRPFFFNYAFWWHLFPRDPFVWAFTPVMEYAVIILVTVIGFACLVCVYLPLRYLARRTQATPETRRYTVFFAGAGLGYLAVEIALLQKYGLFLGHPNYALSVVLAALLFASGMGSLWSGRIVGSLGGIRFVAYALAAFIIAERTFVFPRLSGLVGLPFPARVAIVFALVAPIGLCLGTFIPTALDRLKPSAPAYVPWAWGINGIFSVLAPVLAVAFSMTWGINALLLAAVPVYLVTAWALPSPAP